MLYQILIGLGGIALLVTYLQHQGARSGSRAVFWMSICAITFVLADFFPGEHPLARSLHTLCFAMLPPLYFVTTKQFTNLALPQWASLRAFILGIPLLLGISSAVEQLSLGMPEAPQLSSLDWVAYLFALMSICAAVWRFVSTPRQRQTLVVLMVLPALLVATHVSQNLGWLPEHASASLLAFCIVSSSFFDLKIAGSSVRPVPRSALVDQVRDALFVIDPNHRVVDYNEAAAVWLGANRASLVGQSVDQYFPPELLAVLTDTSTHTSVQPWIKAGVEHWFEIHVTTLIVDKKPNGKIVTLRDISRRRRAEMALEQSREQLQAANAKLAELANTDPLTNIANRRRTLELLELELERHRRSGMTLGLLLLDLDHFKQVNDRFGHPVGDAVLIAAAQCMQETARENDCVGRIGGEEFAIVVVDATENGPEILAERVRANLAALPITTEQSEPVPITASIGCVKYSGGRVDSATLMTLADQALYAAKNAGRNNCQVAAYQSLPDNRSGSILRQNAE